jgi:hypothetical protein
MPLQHDNGSQAARPIDERQTVCRRFPVSHSPGKSSNQFVS